MGVRGLKSSVGNPGNALNPKWGEVPVSCYWRGLLPRFLFASTESNLKRLASNQPSPKLQTATSAKSWVLRPVIELRPSSSIRLHPSPSRYPSPPPPHPLLASLAWLFPYVGPLQKLTGTSLLTKCVRKQNLNRNSADCWAVGCPPSPG